MKVRPTPKGRRVDPQALQEVRRLLGDAPRRRDLLIEHLHRVQDEHGHLSAAHLAALAEEMKLSMTEVFEVATFQKQVQAWQRATESAPHRSARSVRPGTETARERTA